MPDTPTPHDAAAIRAAVQALLKARNALRPLYSAVYNDNGDMIVSRPAIGYDECTDGYFAYLSVERALDSIRARASTPTDDHKPPVCDNPSAGGDHKGQSGKAERVGRGLLTIAADLQWMIDFDKRRRDLEGVETGPDTHIMAPPEWPTHGALANQIAVLNAGAAALATDREAELRAEVERLEVELIAAQPLYSRRQIEARVKVLEEALAFYRDGFSYHPKRSKDGLSLSEWKPTEALLDDCGERARAAIAQTEAGRG